jgi:hypothetical protein
VKDVETMEAEPGTSPVARIGVTAGKVWQYLRDNGSNSLTGLAQQLNEPRDLVMQAIGWLAREDKVDIMESGRTKTVSLRQE